MAEQACAILGTAGDEREGARFSRVPARFTSLAETPLRREVHPGPQVIHMEIR